MFSEPGSWVPAVTFHGMAVLKPIARSAYALVLATLLAAAAFAVDKLDFSGSYNLIKTTGAAKPAKSEAWTLRVVQTESAIEVTRVLNGHQYVHKFPLDGSEGPYVSPGGLMGTCKAQFKSKSLILESFITSHPDPHGPDVQVHTRERWELSSDSNTLKIHTDVDFPQFSGTLPGFQVVQPWSETYIRN